MPKHYHKVNINSFIIYKKSNSLRTKLHFSAGGTTASQEAAMISSFVLLVFTPQFSKCQ